MRIGLNDGTAIVHSSPEEWAEKMRRNGFTACAFPVDCRAQDHVIDAYAKACHDYDIVISEVGAWSSPFTPDPRQAAEARAYIRHQLELADHVRARMCDNVSGAFGPAWPLCYPENFGEKAFRKNVEFIQELLDTVKPRYTNYGLEPMQWMVPDSPEQYAQLIQAVDREHFKVHMDICNMIKDPYTYTHKEELIDRAFDLLGDQIISCHLKDVILDKGITVMIHETLLGTGSLPVKYYLDKIEALNQDACVLLEHLPDLEAYQKALNYVRSVYTFTE